MRPLFWGIVTTVIAFIGWLAVSVYCGIILGLKGDPGFFYMALVYVFGLTWMFSLPVVIVIEIVQWYRRR